MSVSLRVELAVESMIRATELELRLLSDDLGLILPKADLAEINAKVVQAAQLMTRRRTLIEVWELATQRSWGIDPVRYGS